MDFVLLAHFLTISHLCDFLSTFCPDMEPYRNRICIRFCHDTRHGPPIHPQPHQPCRWHADDGEDPFGEAVIFEPNRSLAGVWVPLS